MPLAAGFVGILPALGLLDEARDGVPPVKLSWLSAIGWSCAVAFFGLACLHCSLKVCNSDVLHTAYFCPHLCESKS